MIKAIICFIRWLLTVTDRHHINKTEDNLGATKIALSLHEQFFNLLNEKGLLPNLCERNHYAGYNFSIGDDDGIFTTISVGSTRLGFFSTDELIEAMKSDFLLAHLCLLRQKPDTKKIKTVRLTLDVCPYSSYDFNQHSLTKGKQIILIFTKDDLPVDMPID